MKKERNSDSQRQRQRQQQLSQRQSVNHIYRETAKTNFRKMVCRKLAGKDYFLFNRRERTMDSVMRIFFTLTERTHCLRKLHFIFYYLHFVFSFIFFIFYFFHSIFLRLSFTIHICIDTENRLAHVISICMYKLYISYTSFVSMYQLPFEIHQFIVLRKRVSISESERKRM